MEEEWRYGSEDVHWPFRKTVATKVLKFVWEVCSWFSNKCVDENNAHALKTFFSWSLRGKCFQSGSTTLPYHSQCDMFPPADRPSIPLELWTSPYHWVLENKAVQQEPVTLLITAASVYGLAHLAETIQHSSPIKIWTQLYVDVPQEAKIFHLDESTVEIDQ